MEFCAQPSRLQAGLGDWRRRALLAGDEAGVFRRRQQLRSGLARRFRAQLHAFGFEDATGVLVGYRSVGLESRFALDDGAVVEMHFHRPVAAAGVLAALDGDDLGGVVASARVGEIFDRDIDGAANGGMVDRLARLDAIDALGLGAGSRHRRCRSNPLVGRGRYRLICSGRCRLGRLCPTSGEVRNLGRRYVAQPRHTRLRGDRARLLGGRRALGHVACKLAALRADLHFALRPRRVLLLRDHFEALLVCSIKRLVKGVRLQQPVRLGDLLGLVPAGRLHLLGLARLIFLCLCLTVDIIVGGVQHHFGASDLQAGRDRVVRMRRHGLCSSL